MAPIETSDAERDAGNLLTTDLPDFIRVGSVAKALDISRSAAWRLVWSGVIPSVRLSERSVRVPRVELERYLRERLIREQAS